MFYLFSYQVVCSTWTPATPTWWLRPTLLPRPARTCGGTLTLYASSEETFALLVFIFFVSRCKIDQSTFLKINFQKSYISLPSRVTLCWFYIPRSPVVNWLYLLDCSSLFVFFFFFVLLNAIPRVHVMENHTYSCPKSTINYMYREI